MWPSCNVQQYPAIQYIYIHLFVVYVQQCMSLVQVLVQLLCQSCLLLPVSLLDTAVGSVPTDCMLSDCSTASEASNQQAGT